MDTTSLRCEEFRMACPLVVSFAIFSVFLIPGCAGQVQPSGGPPDTAPPTIIRTFPDTNSVGVSPDRIELEFNEYVDRRSVEESVFISPFIGELEYDWSGREVVIRWSDTLRAGTTYVVNVGTDVVDIRGGNRMGPGFSLAFSTGDHIDEGGASGRVFDSAPEGIMIFAYRLERFDPDTLDPGKTTPYYVTQTGREGNFTLSHLALGEYRVFAIRDQYRNLLYEKETDGFGVMPSDFRLTDDQVNVSNVWFRISKEDTSRPFLSSVSMIDQHTVLLRFSENLDTLSFLDASFSLTDTSSGQHLVIAGSYLNRRDRAVIGLSVTNPMVSNASYRIRAAGLLDDAGNSMDTAHASIVFSGSDIPDTTNPGLSLVGVTDSSRGVSAAGPLEIDFTEAVMSDPLRSAVILEDTSGIVYPTMLLWRDSGSAYLIMLGPLPGKTWCRLTVPLDSVRDSRGNRYRDSVFTVRFETTDPKSMGAVSGRITDHSGSPPGSPVVLTVTPVDAVKGAARTVHLEKPGPFEFKDLVEGQYLLDAFYDTDRSGSYTLGLPFPFLPSERFTVYPDTLKVRASWSLEVVVVVFR